MICTESLYSVVAAGCGTHRARCAFTAAAPMAHTRGAVQRRCGPGHDESGRGRRAWTLASVGLDSITIAAHILQRAPSPVRTTATVSNSTSKSSSSVWFLM
jgi:hypothetical protein